jgi:hypothetical protein
MFIRPTAFLNPVHTHTFPSTSSSATNNIIQSPLPVETSTNVLGLETAPTQTFDAVFPDTSLLIGMGSVVLLCVIAASVWANEVVPVSRTKLAISKSRGEVREYLDGLQQNNTTVVCVDDEESEIVMQYQTEDDGRGFERWLFSDWLNKPTSKGGRQKEPALPILKDAKWNSGDNPVLVTAGIMIIGIVLASITERISS